MLTVVSAALAMVAPGGVVVEGQLLQPPEPGQTVPFTITVTKGGLDYFGRILISLPPDCRLEARQLLGGNLTEDAERNLAVISWLKLPERDQFQLQLDLKVAPTATPGFRSMEWDFSFIRNNDRVSVRPAPFHFEIAPAGALAGTQTPRFERAEDGRESSEGKQPLAAGDDAPSAMRSMERLRDGSWQCTLQLTGLPEGGFVKLSEQWPSECAAEVSSGGGSVAQRSPTGFEFVWFDYANTGNVIYRIENCSLSSFNEIIGSLSYIDGENPQEIAVIPSNWTEYTMDFSENREKSHEIAYEIQVSATKNRVVTDYFKARLEFGFPLEEEEAEGWYKYSFGSSPTYEEARRLRNEVSESYDFIGPFVIAKSGGARIPVQEALLRTGQSWRP